MARQEIPEWSVLPFLKRKHERENFLYSQAIVLRAMLCIFGEWHTLNDEDGHAGDWERWRPTLRKLKTSFDHKGFKGEFLSRLNPLFFGEEGGSISQLNKGARERKQNAEATGGTFKLNPLTDLSVQNTRLSLDFAYGQLRALFGHRVPQGERPGEASDAEIAEEDTMVPERCPRRRSAVTA